jgi:hypothetical protein
MWNVWGRGQVHREIWWGDITARHHLEDLGTDGTIILKSIFKEESRDLIDLAGCCKHDFETLGSIKCGEILE